MILPSGSIWPPCSRRRTLRDSSTLPFSYKKRADYQCVDRAHRYTWTEKTWKKEGERRTGFRDKRKDHG